MAIEFVLETIDSVSIEDTIRFFAGHLGAEIVEGGFARRDGLHVIAGVMPADEIETTEYLLGHRDVVSTTFRFLNNTEDALEQRNRVDVVESVVTFLDDTPTMRGFFTREGEHILLQRLTDEPVVFDARWRELIWGVPLDAFDAIEHGHRRGDLLQPVLSDTDLETLKSQHKRL